MNILIENSNFITTITINRPDKLNALNKATIEELHEALKEEKGYEMNNCLLVKPLEIF